MFRNANNAVFWSVFAQIFLSLAALQAVDGVFALDLAALYFVIWFVLFWYRSYCIRRYDLFPPLPSGVCMPWSGPLYYLPLVWCGLVFACSFASLLWFGLAVPFVVCLLFALAGALWIWKSLYARRGAGV